MRGRGGKKSFQQKMMYGFGALFAVSLLAFLVFFIRSYRREMQTEIEHMEEYILFCTCIFQMIKSAIFCAVMTVILTRKVRKLQKKIWKSI